MSTGKKPLRMIWILLLMLTLLSSMGAFNPVAVWASAPEAVQAANSFNGQAAATWALNNVNSPSASGYYDYSSRGGDCTNFASHALRAGGLTDVGCCGNSQSTSVWWQRNLNWFDANIRRLDRNSYTWSFADKFGTFLVNSGKAAIIQTAYRSSLSPSNFKLGDIVQISSSRSVSGATHTMIVTQVSAQGIFVTYRNANNFPVARNAKLQDIINRMPNNYFIQLRVK